MLEEVQQHLLGSFFYGVSVYVHSDGQKEFSGVLLKKVKDELVLVEELRSENNLNAFVTQLTPHIPVALFVDGKGVIDKHIPEIEQDENNILNSIFPNANPNDFCTQKEIIDQKLYVSLIRKSYANDLINDIVNEGLKPIHFSFGKYRFLSLIDVDDLRNTTYAINRYNISINDVVQIEPNPNNILSHTIQLDGQTYKHINTASINGVVELFSDGKAVLPAIDEQKSEVVHKSLFKYGIVSVVFIALFAFGITYWLSAEVEERIITLNSNLDKNKEQIVEIASLKKSLKEKRELLYYLGLIDPVQISFYGDKIGESVPYEIRLVKLDFNPVKLNRQNGVEEVIFQEKEIIIEGITKKSLHLNKWIKAVHEFEWIADVNILSYERSKNKSESKFKLQLKLSEVS